MPAGTAGGQNVKYQARNLYACCFVEKHEFCGSTFVAAHTAVALQRSLRHELCVLLLLLLGRWESSPLRHAFVDFGGGVSARALDSAALRAPHEYT